MADYKNYLAANILSEDKVTYRLLSRALKVHVNAAKEMLYEFHRTQNGKKPGTVHATYLISGTKPAEEPQSIPTIKKDGEDEYMQSSPFMNSSMPQIDEGTGASSVLTITLTREEDLEKTRSQYEHINSIHIYSLGPHPLKDLQLLSDSSRELQSLTASEDPLSSLTQYGTIANPAVKRRANRRPPPAPAPASVLAVQPKPKPVEVKAETKVKVEPKASQSSSAKDFFAKGKEKTKTATPNGGGSKESTPTPPALKKESSSLFKSFAKAKPKLKREGTDSSAVASAAEDEPMKDVSDDEEETYVPPAPSSEIVDKDRKNRKEREAALKKMMDDDEDEVVPSNPTPEPEPEEEDAEVLEEVKVKEEPEPEVEVKDGRRRGRRRVMKKRTVKDEEDFLVTIEEAVWESFSEDEPAPKAKPKVQASSTASKAKKPAAKAGQGNIMSFFGKK